MRADPAATPWAKLRRGVYPYIEDGECDEPEGTNNCPEGSDVINCG